MDKFKVLWARIPLPVRTVINVGLAAALAAVISSIVADKLDWHSVLLGAVTAFGTAVVRAINPADAGYGVGANPAPVPAPIDPGPPVDPSLATDPGVVPDPVPVDPAAVVAP